MNRKVSIKNRKVSILKFKNIQLNNQVKLDCYLKL